MTSDKDKIKVLLSYIQEINRNIQNPEKMNGEELLWRCSHINELTSAILKAEDLQPDLEEMKQ